MRSTDQLRRAVLDQLESLQQAGVLQLPKILPPTVVASVTQPAAQHSVGLVENPPHAASERAERMAATVAAELKSMVTNNPVRQPTNDKSLVELPTQSAPSEAPAPTLTVLQKRVASCTRCNELAKTRTQTVFGIGDPKARLCFLGEAPGADEDKTGIPFVGRAGQLLTKIIEACRLKREDVYILNMLKCRPPDNRNPLPHELANCRGYLENQLDLIRPEFICCLGAVASQNLLQTTVPIGKLRGKIHTFRGVKVVCTYHPAFLLRSPSFKKETWEDMKMLMHEMGVELQ
jgi:DNA polymerase